MVLRNLIFTFSIFFCIPFQIFSIDLQEALYFSKLTDTTVDNNIILSESYIAEDPSKAINFISQTIQETENSLLKAKSFLYTGIVYNFSFSNKEEQALENLLIAKKIYQQFNDIEKAILVDIIIGQVYLSSGDSSIALNNFNRAFNAATNTKAHSLAYLAHLASIDLDYNLLVSNNNFLNQLISNLNNTQQKAYAYFISYKRAIINNWDNLAIEFLDSAQVLYESSSFYNQSIDMIIKKAEIFEQNNNVQQVVQINELIYQKSIDHNYGKGLIYSCYKLADFFESIERYDFANPYLKYINKIEMAEGEKELNQKILLAEKEKKIDLERISAKNEVEYQGYLTMLGFGVALLILILALYIFSAYKTKSKLATDLLLAYNNNEELKKEKDDFLAYTTHEIRTPLSAVISASEILDRTTLNKSQKKHLKALKSSASNILFLVNDILDLAKLEKRKITLEKSSFSPFNVIENTISILNSKAIDNNVKIEFNHDQSVPENILGDPFRFQQVVVNLLDNAIKYAPNGTASITMNLHQNNYLKVVVKDNGKGIEKDKLKMIFKPYAQEKINTSRQYGGTGLGLAICDLIIKLMEGNIKVNSTSNGTEFTFIIPIDVVKNNKKTLSKSNDFSLKNINILMAEDDELNGNLFQNLIQNKDNNIHVDWVKNGEEVMEKIFLKSYQVILMDIEMPLKNGFETSQEIRNNENKAIKNIPIIAMTAHLVEDVLQRCYQSGINDCISKPFQIEFLYKKIYDTLNIPMDNFNPLATNKAKYFKIYTDNFRKDYQILEKAIKDHKEESIKSKLHKMKGASATMKFSNMANLLSKMESKKAVDLVDDLSAIKKQFFIDTKQTL